VPRGRSGRRTDYGWQGSLVSETTDAATQESIIRVFSEASTVVRVRGFLRCIFATVSDGDLVTLAAGLLIRPEGFTAGVNPLSDLEKSWMWHSFGSMVRDAAFSGVGQLFFDFEIDSKAMRKVKQNDELVLMVNHLDNTGTATIAWTGGVRVLVGR